MDSSSFKDDFVNVILPYDILQNSDCLFGINSCTRNLVNNYSTHMLVSHSQTTGLRLFPT